MLLCMRTTIDVNAELPRAAKRRAAQERRTLRDVVEAALRAYLGKPAVRRVTVEVKPAAEGAEVIVEAREWEADARRFLREV